MLPNTQEIRLGAPAQPLTEAVRQQTVPAANQRDRRSTTFRPRGENGAPRLIAAMARSRSTITHQGDAGERIAVADRERTEFRSLVNPAGLVLRSTLRRCVSLRCPQGSW